MLMANLQDDVSDIELKQRWRLYWIGTIFEFANTNLQKIAWLNAVTAEWPDGEAWVSSYEELIEAYFDILALDDAYENALKWGNVSQEEADQAKEFHILAAFYTEPDNDPKSILHDEEWLEVTDAAKDFWHYLKENVTASREIELIQKLEKQFPF